jgi:hypothetical protein
MVTLEETIMIVSLKEYCRQVVSRTNNHDGDYL